MRLDWIPERLKARAWRDQHFKYAHAKIDGWYVQVVKQKDDRLVVYGRDDLPSMELSRRFPSIRLERWYQSLKKNLLPRTCVCGEIHVPDGRGSDVPSGLKGTLPLDLTVFAVPWINGDYQSHVQLETVSVQCLKFGVRFAAFLTHQQVQNYRTRVRGSSSLETMRDTLLRLAKKYGYEGWVLKNANYQDWWKLKESPTIDCVVIGWKQGQGKYSNMIGSLRVGVFNEFENMTEIASISGMTDEKRAEMTDLARRDPEVLVGRVCEVAYQYVGSGGRLRHPRFKCWRKDKPATQCGTEQLKQ